VGLDREKVVHDSGCSSVVDALVWSYLDVFTQLLKWSCLVIVVVFVARLFYFGQCVALAWREIWNRIGRAPCCCPTDTFEVNWYCG
jgi:hypothetical protein